MGFTKLDEGILRSSIMAEDPATFKVWIALLASCRADGVADVSSVFLGAVCHLPIEQVDEALKKLSSPDERSRGEEDGGRRIKRVDGGYFIVNYFKYRAFTYKDTPEAERKRDYRERKKKGQVRTYRTNSGQFGTCPDISASASSLSSSSKERHKTKKPSLFFNGDTKEWEGITDEDMAVWAEAYPGCDIKAELAKMKAWLLGDWPRRRKEKWKAFIVRWLSKEQDRGGTKRRAESDPEDFTERQMKALKGK